MGDDTPTPDRIPVNIRVGIYSASLTLPFVGLALRLLTGVEAIAALTVTLGAMGPALALTYTPPKDDEDE